MSRWFKHIVIVLSVSLALGACSRMGLAYRNLDVIIPWTLSDYLDMNGEQKSWLDERLKEHLSWHCTTQLPGYLEWLDRLQTMIATNQVSDAALQARAHEAEQAIAETAREITPSAIELLQGLDDRQVADMNEAFAKDQRKRQEVYLKPSLDQQVKERGDRMEKRLNDWLGPLSTTQRQRVTTWSGALGDQNTQWIANRAHWQKQFSAAVAQRQSPQFPQRIETLLVNRESLWTPAYRQAFANTEAQARSLFVDLMAESTPNQRERLLKKIEGVRKDFSDLKCLKAAKQG
jgi:HPt (histidine-containing phosphotransfer) domain-containing protein